VLITGPRADSPGAKPLLPIAGKVGLVPELEREPYTDRSAADDLAPSERARAGAGAD
jgi:hypothetical protein